MPLRAKTPEKIEKRLKMFIYGPAGVGKTTSVLQFPSSYIIDTEHGTDEYAEIIAASNSVVFNTTSLDDARQEVRALLSEKHPYRTLVIDPITHLYNDAQEKWARIFTKYAKTQKDAEIQDFGVRYWAKVKADFKSFERLLLSLDMNVIVTAHQKDVYGQGFTKLGVTFDSMRGDDYVFDLVFRIERRNGLVYAIKEKERALPGKNRFPNEFEWSYENFLEYYGKDVIEREAKPVELATEEQLEKLNKFLAVLNIPEEELMKILKKANVDSWEDMPRDKMQLTLEWLENKVK